MQNEDINPKETVQIARDLLGTVLGEATIDTLAIMLVEEVLDSGVKNPREYMGNILQAMENNFVVVHAQRAHKTTMTAALINAQYAVTHAIDTHMIAETILQFESQAVHNQSAEALSNVFDMFVKDCEKLNDVMKPHQSLVKAWQSNRIRVASTRMEKLAEFKKLIMQVSEAGLNEKWTKETKEFIHALHNMRSGAQPKLAGYVVSKENQKSDTILDNQLEILKQIAGEISV